MTHQFFCATLRLLGLSGNKSNIYIGELQHTLQWHLRSNSKATSDEVNKLVSARNAARKVKNFDEADRIRDELAKMGVVLKDTKDGTTWEIARL